MYTCGHSFLDDKVRRGRVWSSKIKWLEICRRRQHLRKRDLEREREEMGFCLFERTAETAPHVDTLDYSIKNPYLTPKALGLRLGFCFYCLIGDIHV